MWEMVKDDAYSKCWIDLSDVVKGKRNGKEYNDWKNSIERKIGVRYKWRNDDVEERSFEIVEYDKKGKLTLKWNENKYLINTDQLQRGGCGDIFGKVTSKFKYEIGQVVKGLTILDRYYKKCKKGRQKWYKCQCEKEGHVYEIKESDLNRYHGCLYCSNKRVLEGYNDIATTRPDLVRYFSNPDEAKKYTHKSSKEITVKCPLCGKEKQMKILNLANRSFSCSNCSDGVPLTEKFMSNLLFSKNIEYIVQATKKNFDWIKDNSRYDFALPTYKIIIEIDGNLLSHEDRTKDDYKDKIALNNGWSVVRINLLGNYTGSFKQLWNKYKPVLNNLGVHITEEEAKECYIKSQTSLFWLIVNVTKKNPKLNQQEIADKLKEEYGYQLSHSTIHYYLKKSNEMDSTNYQSKQKKAVICVTTEKIYESMMEADRQTGVDYRHISRCCNGKLKSAGKDENGNKLEWMFLEDYLKSLK